MGCGENNLPVFFFFFPGDHRIVYVVDNKLDDRECRFVAIFKEKRGCLL